MLDRFILSFSFFVSLQFAVKKFWLVEEGGSTGLLSARPGTDLINKFYCKFKLSDWLKKLPPNQNGYNNRSENLY